jgi:hypothetical protein
MAHVKAKINALTVALTEKDIAQIEEACRIDPGLPQNYLSGSLFDNEDETPKVSEGPQDIWLTATLGTFDWVDSPKAIKTFR